jgi:hypothetical protein
MHRAVYVYEHHSVKAHRKCGDKAPHILDLEPLWRCVSSITFLCTLDRNLGGPHRVCESVGRKE